jgi:hypothetical protein
MTDNGAKEEKEIRAKDRKFDKKRMKQNIGYGR